MKIQIPDKDGEYKEMLAAIGKVSGISFIATINKMLIREKYYEMFPQKLEEKKKKVVSNG